MKAIRNLLYKEFVLAKHPTMFFFPLFSCMLLIPNYPYLIGFMYTCLEVFFIFITGRENNDVLYTASLPIPKKDVVKARCAMIAIIQLFQILLSIPFAFLRARMVPALGPNGAGMEANAALFGFAFIMYALFNHLMLTTFYKDGHSAGKGLIYGGIGVILVIGLAETLSVLAPWLDSIASSDLLRQLPILACGALIYGVGLWFSCRRAARLFEKVDL